MPAADVIAPLDAIDLPQDILGCDRDIPLLLALDRRRHGATGTASVLLLPPGVPHDGRTVTAAGFRKRNLYLDDSVLPQRLAGRAVDAPVFSDGLLRYRIDQLHAALVHAGDGFEAESRLSLIRERLHFHLDALQPGRPLWSSEPPMKPTRRIT